MKTIFTPTDIDDIMRATIGTLDELSELEEPARSRLLQRREAFVDNVGEEVAKKVMEIRGEANTRVIVFAGYGLCGAFALAAATELHTMGCHARVVLFNIGGKCLSADCAAARENFLSVCGADYLTEVINPGVDFAMPQLKRRTIVVDGIFGSEDLKPLRGGYQAVARYINEHSPQVISIDLPSGMTTRLNVGMINRNIVHATYTLALIGPTLSFFMPENAELLGAWSVLPVAVNRDALDSVKRNHLLIDAEAIRNVLPKRPSTVSKADLGDVLIFAGSYGMLGAAVLATRAATHSGCGRVTCHGPRCAFFVMQSAVPSAMFTTDGADIDIRQFDNPRNCQGVAIGPGLGTSKATAEGLGAFLKSCYAERRPLILDADALNIIAQNPSFIDYIPPHSVITPHAGEFDRLFGEQSSHGTRTLTAIEMAARYKITIVLKGPYTQTIWSDGSLIVNTSGTEALATAGSGDVLTGLLAGFVAQKMSPEVAAVAAVYVHGVAGRIAARSCGSYGTTAEDVADAIGPAIDYILNPRRQQPAYDCQI